MKTERLHHAPSGRSVHARSCAVHARSWAAVAKVEGDIVVMAALVVGNGAAGLAIS